MITTINKAVNRLEWRFKNTWRQSLKEDDIHALNKIIEFIEDKHKKQIQDYHLFAKLYIMVYAQFLEKYNATVFDKIPVKELSRYLDQPLENIIQRFTDKLNESELYELFNEVGIEQKHPVLVGEEQKNKETDLLIETINSDENLRRLKGQVWDYETIKENIELQVNNAINTFK